MFSNRDQKAIYQLQYFFLKEQVAEISQPISFPSECTHPACNKAVHHKLPGYSKMKFMFPNFSLSCARVFKYLYSEFALIHKQRTSAVLFKSFYHSEESHDTPLSPLPAPDEHFLKQTFGITECVVINS